MDGRTVQFGSGEDLGKVYYRASALGSECQKMLVAARLDYTPIPPPADVQKRFDAGHAIEAPIVARMRDEGWVVWDEQAEVLLQLTGKIFVRGHIDCKGRPGGVDGGTYVVDIKSQSQAEWDDFRKKGWDSGYFPKYRWQFSSYMHALDMPGCLVRVNRATGEMDVTWIERPFYSVTEIRARVLEIERLASDGSLPEGCSPGKVWPCPFPYIHTDVAETIDAGTLVGVQEAAVIRSLAVQYDTAAKEEKAAKERKDAAKKAAVALRAGRDALVLQDGTRLSFWTQRVGRRGLSAEAEERLRAFLLLWLGVDLDEWRTQAEATMMRVKLPREDTAEKEKEKNDE